MLLQQESQIPQSTYQQSLEDTEQQPVKLTAETVRYWSDYNRVYYHPRSIVQINDHEVNSEVLPFERYDTGEEVFRDLGRDDDLLDRDMRLFVEECDMMQGFQVLASNDDAWGGFASRYIEALRDEYGKLPIWTWSLGETYKTDSRAAQSLRYLNTAKMVAELAALDSFHIPVSINTRATPDYVKLDMDSQWSRSGFISSFIETMTLPTRRVPLDGRQGHLSDLEMALNTNGNQRLANLMGKASRPITSVTKPESHGGNDARIPGNKVARSVDDEADDGSLALDIDLSGLPVDTNRSGRGYGPTRTFGTAQSFRGHQAHHRAEEQADDVGLMRKQRRFHDKAVLERYGSKPRPLHHTVRSSENLRSQMQVLHRNIVPNSGQLPSSIRQCHGWPSGHDRILVHIQRLHASCTRLTAEIQPSGDGERA